MKWILWWKDQWSSTTNFLIYLRGLAHPVINYAKKYPGDKTINHAQGEIVKFKMSSPPEDIWIGKRFLGDGRDELGEYDTIHVYLGRGWFKLISKVY